MTVCCSGVFCFCSSFSFRENRSECVLQTLIGRRFKHAAVLLLNRTFSYLRSLVSSRPSVHREAFLPTPGHPLRGMFWLSRGCRGRLLLRRLQLSFTMKMYMKPDRSLKEQKRMSCSITCVFALSGDCEKRLVVLKATSA